MMTSRGLPALPLQVGTLYLSWNDSPTVPLRSLAARERLFHTSAAIIHMKNSGACASQRNQYGVVGMERDVWTRSAQMLPLKRGIAECSGLHRAAVSAESDRQLPLRSAHHVLRGRGGWDWHWRNDCHRAAPHAWLVYRRGALAAWKASDSEQGSSGRRTICYWGNYCVPAASTAVTACFEATLNMPTDV